MVVWAKILIDLGQAALGFWSWYMDLTSLGPYAMTSSQNIFSFGPPTQSISTSSRKLLGGCTCTLWISYNAEVNLTYLVIN